MKRSFGLRDFSDYSSAQTPKLDFFSNFIHGRFLDIGGSRFPAEKVTEHENTVTLDLEKPEEPVTDFVRFDLDEVPETSMPFKDDSFDTVLAGDILEHLDNTAAVVEEVRRVLKPDGLFLVSTPTPRFYAEILNMAIKSKPIYFPDHIQAYSREQMKLILEKNSFEIEKTVGYNFWLPFISKGVVNTEYKLPELLTWQQLYVARLKE